MTADRPAHLAGTAGSVRFGLDVYSLRSQGWTPFQHLDFCAARGIRVVHFSEIRLLGGLEPDHVRRVRAYADRLGIALEVGMRSICPSSTIFESSAGAPEEQIVRMLDTARLAGSPLVRCIVGRFTDRAAPGGIERRIQDTLEVLRRVRSRVMDAGLKLAIENHAGDMQARELKTLVEEAGPEFVGVCLDSGNPLWAMEDPHLALETLGPYVLTSHVRDGIVWPTPDGAAVVWTRMGEGSVGIADYIRRFADACPGRAMSLEVIVSDEPRVLPYRDPQFWTAYRSMPASELVRFQALAAAGSPPPSRPLLSGSEAASRELDDVESSIRWTAAFLESLSER
jgi:sugar phosphate isomerase/epimerase